MNEQMYSQAKLEAQRVSLGEQVNLVMEIQPEPFAEWSVSRACAGTDPAIFFPETGTQLAEAKKICMDCPVRLQCLRYAIDTRERHGVWGGLSEAELRRAIRIYVKMAPAFDSDVDLSNYSQEHAG